MGLVSTDLRDKPYPWPIRLMSELKAYSDSRGIRPRESEIFQPYDHGYNAIFLERFDRDLLVIFRAMLTEFLQDVGSNEAGINSAIKDVIGVLEQEISRKCPH